MSSILTDVNEHKEIGNTHFKNENYTDAMTSYTRAIALLEGGKHEKHEKHDKTSASTLCILYSNRATCHLKLAASNASHHHHYTDALSDLKSSLQHDSTYLKSVWREVQAHEGMASYLHTCEGREEDELKHLTSALTCLTRLKGWSGGDINTINAATTRISRLVTQRREALMTPSVVIRRLRMGTSTDLITDMRRAMSFYVNDTHHQSTCHREGLPLVLLDIILSSQHSWEIRGTATRALRTLMSTALPIGTTLSTTRPTPLPTTSHHAVSCANDDGTLCVTPFIPHIHAVLSLLQQLITDIDTALPPINPPTPTSDIQQRMITCHALIGLIARMASHRDLVNVSHKLIESLVKILSLPSAILAEEKKSDYKYILPHHLTSRYLTTFESLAFIANAHVIPRTHVRKLATSILLFSSLASYPQLRASLIAALSVIAQIRQVKPDDNTVDEKTIKMEGEADETFRQQCHQLILAPLASHLVSASSNALIDPTQLTSMQRQHMKLSVRALGLLISANPAVGIMIVTYGMSKQQQKDGSVHTISGGPNEDLEKKMQELKDNILAKEQKEKPKIEVIDEKDDPEVQAEADDTPTTPLQFLLTLSCCPDDELRELSTQVLALASSDTNVRTAVAKSGQSDVLYELLEEKDELQQDSKQEIVEQQDLLVSCHAVLALSKLGAVGETTATEEQTIRLVKTVMHVLTTCEAWEEQRKKMEKEKEKEKNTAEVTGDVDTSSLTRFQSHELVRHAIESLAYLTLTIDAKKCLATYQGGAWLSTLFRYAGVEDQSVRFGMAQIVRNMTQSSEDIKAEYDTEVEQLRKLAQKGLPNKQASDVDLALRAGSETAIKAITHVVVKHGGVKAIISLVKAYVIADQEKKEQEEEMEQGKMKTKEEKEAEQAARAKKEAQRAHAEEVAKKWGRPAHKEEKHFTYGMSHKVAESMSGALLKMASDPTNRGMMVQQGALSSLLSLAQHESEKARDNAALALARIAITTNPNLFPQQGQIMAMIVPLLSYLRRASHELHQFEILMALTNLTSVSDEVKEKMMLESGWSDARYLLASDNGMVQRAAIECMTNLVTCNTAIERLRADTGDHDIRLFLAFAQSDDLATQTAATGALAMMTDDAEVARRVADCMLESEVPAEESDVKDQKTDETGKRVKVQRSALDVLQVLHLHPDVHAQVKLRVEACMKNLQRHGLVQKINPQEIQEVDEDEDD